MTVRAKFKVQSTTEAEGGLKSANLTPIVSGSKENEEFFKWTPGGQINLSTMNPRAAAQFVPGKVFYVDFTPEGETLFQGELVEARSHNEFAIVQRTGGAVSASVYYAGTRAEAEALSAKVSAEHGGEFRIFERVPD